jgi:hypothetical protein
MRVGIDGQRHSGLLGSQCRRIWQIEPPWLSINLERGAGLKAGRKHRVKVEIQRRSVAE